MTEDDRKVRTMKELEQRHLDAMRRLYEQKDQRKLLTPRELLERLRKK